MSSPKKKSIREARLEKIERLLEEHENSMSSFLPLVSHPSIVACSSLGVHFVVACNIKIVSLTLKASEKNSKKNIKSGSKNTNQYVVQVAFYKCETTAKSRLIHLHFVLQIINVDPLTFS